MRISGLLGRRISFVQFLSAHQDTGVTAILAMKQASSKRNSERTNLIFAK